MRSTERLERQSERSRERVADLIDELRERVVPSEMVDQFMDLSGNGVARDFVRNLGHQVRSNPLPVMLIGAGLAWLMLSERNTRSLAMKSAAGERTSGRRRRRGRRTAKAGRKRRARRSAAVA